MSPDPGRLASQGWTDASGHAWVRPEPRKDQRPL